jgi:hypothetical protein
MRRDLKNPSGGCYSRTHRWFFFQKTKQPEIQGPCVSLPLCTDYLPSTMHNINKNTKKKEITRHAGTHPRNTQLRAKI